VFKSRPINTSHSSGVSKLGLALANSTAIPASSPIFTDTHSASPKISIPAATSSARSALITRVKSGATTSQDLPQVESIEKLLKKRRLAAEPSVVGLNPAKKPNLLER